MLTRESELRVHFEPFLWREYSDTASEHPMALVIRDIVHTYKRIGSKTLVMPARYARTYIISWNSLHRLLQT